MRVAATATRPRPARVPTGARTAAAIDVFPLAVHASGRYLVDAQGTPFLIHGDTPWSIAAQLTDAECDQYIADRAAKGFTAIMFNAPEHNFTSQTPAYNNVDGIAPFATMTDFGSAMTAYWSRVDRIVNTCKANNIVCIINPAYLGWAGTDDGWDDEVTADTAGHLQTYGATLATRYNQGNIIWCMGGDQSPGATLRDKQWNIVTGIRSVRTTDIVTAHGGNANAWPTWNGMTGFSFNSVYTSEWSIYSQCATEYARSGPMPFFLLEAIYEQERSPAIDAAGLRRQSYQALLSGACGQMFGNNPIWHFESPNTLFTYSGTWESNLDSTGSVQQQYVKQLFAAFEWWKLVPKTDASLVSSSLSSGDTRLCPALASDGSFALIWVPSSQSVTVVMSNFTPASVRVRLYDASAGTYSTVGTYANTGTQSIATGGERVIVLDGG